MAVAVIETAELEVLIERVVRKVVGERPRPAELYTSEQVAAEIGVTRVTIERAAREGRIKSTRRGRSYRFAREDIDTYRRGPRRMTALAREAAAKLLAEP